MQPVKLVDGMKNYPPVGSTLAGGNTGELRCDGCAWSAERWKKVERPLGGQPHAENGGANANERLSDAAPLKQATGRSDDEDEGAAKAGESCDADSGVEMGKGGRQGTERWEIDGWRGEEGEREDGVCGSWFRGGAKAQDVTFWTAVQREIFFEKNNNLLCNSQTRQLASLVGPDWNWPIRSHARL